MWNDQSFQDITAVKQIESGRLYGCSLYGLELDQGWVAKWSAEAASLSSTLEPPAGGGTGALSQIDSELGFRGGFLLVGYLQPKQVASAPSPTPIWNLALYDILYNITILWCILWYHMMCIKVLWYHRPWYCTWYHNPCNYDITISWYNRPLIL